MKKLLLIILIVVGIVILGFQYFGYSTKHLDPQSLQEITDKFHLNLTGDNWKIEEYSKNTLINAKPTHYYIYNHFLSYDEYHTTLYVSEGNEIFEEFVITRILDNNKRNEVMIEKQITHNNIDMTIQVLETEDEDIVMEYSAILKVIFNYNDCLYEFNFDKTPTFSYSTQSNEIHEDEINKCLEIIDTILVYH